MYISIEQIRKIVRSEILKEYRQALEESSFDSWDKGEFRHNETPITPEVASDNDPLGRTLSVTPKRRDSGGTAAMEKPESEKNSPLAATVRRNLVGRAMAGHTYSKGGVYTKQYEIDPDSPPGRTNLIFHPREGHTLDRDETSSIDLHLKLAIHRGEPSDHEESIKYNVKFVIPKSSSRSQPFDLHGWNHGI